ncbi:MAG: tetratricopeptide repeat protein [Candidatus Obscuribacterales bacterium]|nr:tetratricopeptide repeat protein [Candidatus Obscuribacterales bacterium]
MKLLLGEILVESGLISARRLLSGLEYAQAKELPLGRTLKLLRYIDENQLQDALRAQRVISEGLESKIAIDALKQSLDGRVSFEAALDKNLEESRKIDLAAQEKDISENETAEALDEPPGKMIKNGDILFQSDRCDEAEIQYKNACSKLESLLGTMHINVCPVLQKLANLYLVTDRFAEAELLYMRILRIKEQSFGGDHLQVAAALENLADLFDIRKEFEKAEQFFLTALSIREKFLMEGYEDYLTTLKKLAAISSRFKQTFRRRMTGEILLKSGIVSEEQLKSSLLKAKQNNIPVGAVLREEGCLSDLELKSALEAQSLIKNGLLPETIAIKIVANAGKQKVSLRKWLSASGIVSSRNQESPLDKELAEDLSLLLSLEQSHGPKHEDLAVICARMAKLYLKRGDSIDAELNFMRALNIWKAKSMQTERAYGSACIKLAAIYTKSDRSLQAQPLINEAMSCLQKHGELESEDMTACLSMKAKVELDQRNSGASVNICCSALSMSAYLNEELICDTLKVLVSASSELGQAEPSISTCRKLLQDMQAKFGQVSPEAAKVLDYFGDLYQAHGMPDMARTQYNFALQVYEHLYEANFPALLDLKSKLACLDL